MTERKEALQALLAKVEAGADVYISANHSWSKSGPARIEKVGRKWVHLDGMNGRFDLETGVIDGKGLSSPGVVWACEADYRRYRERQIGWQRVQEAVRGAIKCPDHLTIDDLNDILSALIAQEDTGEGE